MHFHHKASYVLLLLCFPLLAKSQILIHGFVKDSQGNAIPNAVIMLQTKSDNSIVKSEMTDSLGHYSLSYNNLINTQLAVNAFGFEDEKKSFSAQENRTNIPLDFTLKLKSTQLEEVTILQKKPLFERKIDRTVFNVDESIAAIGSDALEMLAKAPGVLVNSLDNTIQLAGKSQIMVLINGRLLSLSGEDLVAYLKSIPAETIQRIELITSPPAKYDAAGNSGIIDIILKKNTAFGFNGTLRGGYAQASHEKIMAGATLNYQKNKWNFYSNLNYSKAKNNIIERLNTPFSSQTMEMTDVHLRTLQPLSYRVGVDYKVHKNGILGIVWMGNNFWRADDEQIKNKLETNNSLDSLMITTGFNEQNTKNNSINLNYDWSIDSSGKKLSINVNNLGFSGESMMNYETRNFLTESLIPTGTNSKNKIGGNQDIDIGTAQIDVVLPYKLASISFGGKLSNIGNRSRNFFEYFEDNQFINDPNISNVFDYSEHVQALYVNSQNQWKKWGVQLGLRGEFTQTKGFSQTLNELHTNQYFQLFPSAYFSYKLKETNTLNLNYTKRISRPGYSQLNPFRAYTSPYFYSQGNPFLQPYFNHNIELGYSLNYKYFLNLFFQTANKEIGTIWETEPIDKVTFVKTGNYFNTRSFGLSAMVSFNLSNFWELQTQGYLSYKTLNTPSYLQYETLSFPYYYLFANSSFSLNSSKTFLAEINGYYSGKSQYGYFLFEPFYNVNAGFKALFFEKKLLLSLNLQDIFNSNANRKARNELTQQTMNNDLDIRSVSLNVSYQLGSSKIKSARNRKTGIEEEEKRL